jgi:hypothetical protein
VIRRPILVLSLVFVILAISPARVAACSCVPPPPDQTFWGDVAFIGVVAEKDTPVFPLGTHAYGISYTFAVEEVLKGDAEAFTVIRSGIGGGDCGIPMAVGERWQIDAHRFEGNLWATICGGSHVLAVGVRPPPVPAQVTPEVVAVAAAALGIVGIALLRLRRNRERSAS